MMRLRDLPTSVTARLVASAVAILAVVVAGLVTAELLGSRSRIDTEMRSSSDLAQMVIHYAMRGIGSEPDPEAALRQLAQELDAMRHIEVQYLAEDDSIPNLPNPAPPRVKHAPHWFAAHISTAPARRLYPVIAGGRVYGTMVVTDYPGDEIDEIWDDLWHEILGLVLAALLITAAITWVVRRALRPVEAVADGMERMNHGQFTTVEDVEVYELRNIGNRFNALGNSLQRAGADNRLLIDRMMTIQEHEREEIARELHDEVGSTLFSIRAELVALRNPEPGDDDIAHRIGDLESMIETVQRRNGRLLERLRPMALDYLSLADAIRDLVMTWDTRAGDTRWMYDVDDEIGEPDRASALAIYRVVQECLTNAARHAHARWVKVGAWSDRATRRLHVEIRDDGVGPPPDLHMGYGLLGATERVHKLGGTLSVGRNSPRGMIVSFDVPAAEMAALRIHGP